VIDLVVPWPPSTNAMWRNVVIKGAGRTLLSAEGREYRDTVARVVQRLGITCPTICRLRVELRACPPDRRRRDLDNILKGALDALTHAGVWDDDSLIDELTVVRGEVGSGLVYVRIIDLPSAQEALPIPKPKQPREERACAF
jgi:crossover junction endodeoxyribonuclease RusA